MANITIANCAIYSVFQPSDEYTEWHRQKEYKPQAHRWWPGLRRNPCMITQLVVVYNKSKEKVSQTPGCNSPSPFKSSVLKLSVSHGSEKQPEPADWRLLLLLLPRNPGYHHYHSRQSSSVGDGDEEISGACGASGHSYHPQSWNRSQRWSHSLSPNQSYSRKRSGWHGAGHLGDK